MKKFITTFTIIMAAACVMPARADFLLLKSNNMWKELADSASTISDVFVDDEVPDSIMITRRMVDEIICGDSITATSDSIKLSQDVLLPDYFMIPTIFDFYNSEYNDLGQKVTDVPVDENSPLAWVDRRIDAASRFRSLKQNYMIANPEAVKYNINSLPEAPKRYYGIVDPSTARIIIVEEPIDMDKVHEEVEPLEVKKKHWLHTADAQLQFSQAFISPNWYQGGNDNLNFILNLGWDVKLNTAYHPNLLFENSIRYKLALTSAPDDSLRNYSISEDLFQLNTRFGVKATKNWYYSATLQFKTQFFPNYKSNTRNLMAAILSPGELNIGLGMTYNHTSANKKLTVSASISPLSYNFKTCLNHKIDPTDFGIKAGHRAVSQIGSGIDATLTWNIAHNVKLLSHLTGFSDYSYIQADWENTFSFTINRFLSTQIYVDMRYDTQTPAVEGSKWHKFQLKEILSFGFAYNFSTL